VNTWVDIEANYNATDRALRLFVNGSVVGSFSAVLAGAKVDSTGSENTTWMDVGTSWDVTGQSDVSFIGRIDDVRYIVEGGGRTANYVTQTGPNLLIPYPTSRYVPTGYVDVTALKSGVAMHTLRYTLSTLVNAPRVTFNLGFDDAFDATPAGDRFGGVFGNEAVLPGSQYVASQGVSMVVGPGGGVQITTPDEFYGDPVATADPALSGVKLLVVRYLSGAGNYVDIISDRQITAVTVQSHGGPGQFFFATLNGAFFAGQGFSAGGGGPSIGTSPWDSSLTVTQNLDPLTGMIEAQGKEIRRMRIQCTSGAMMLDNLRLTVIA